MAASAAGRRPMRSGQSRTPCAKASSAGRPPRPQGRRACRPAVGASVAAHRPPALARRLTRSARRP
eukprot:15203912-Alexandrium_andersonii.AAC.1